MKKIVLFTFSMLIFWACTDKKPKNLLPQSEMTDLLYELVLIGAIESSSYRQDTVYVTQMPENLLEKYHLDSLEFAKQHRYYLQYEPQIYADMMDTIQNRFLQKVEKLGVKKTQTIKKNNKLLKTIVKKDSVK